MNYILFDDDSSESLKPLTHTRPVSEIRIGILRIREKWEKILPGNYSYLTSDYLKKKYPCLSDKQNILINGSLLPLPELIAAIQLLKSGESLVKDELLLAGRIDGNIEGVTNISEISFSESKTFKASISSIRFPWDIFSKNDEALKSDFLQLTKDRKSANINSTNTLIKPENIFAEEGAKIECAILNASSGYIYLGKDSEIMEGAMIRGSFALGEHSQVKMGAKIYGSTTIGPYSKVGGEISNSVIAGYTNKAHDGFLGNSVLGEWCNIGADTNNSNLKNNYSKIKVWNYKEENYVNSGLQFCGLIMGDHSKCSINTMFNTGTVVGVSANIFGNGFPPKFIPSFAWGGSEGFTTYRIEEALDVAKRVYERRQMVLDEVEQSILKHLFDSTTKFRAW